MQSPFFQVGQVQRMTNQGESQTRLATCNQMSAVHTVLHLLIVNNNRCYFLNLVCLWLIYTMIGYYGYWRFNRDTLAAKQCDSVSAWGDKEFGISKADLLKSVFCVVPLWLLTAGRGNQSCTHSVTCIHA